MNDDALKNFGLIDAQGKIADRAAQKVFSTPAVMWNHPIATYMARLAPRTRMGLVTYLGIARDILSDRRVGLAEFPWCRLEYQQMARLRRALLDKYSSDMVNHVLICTRGVLKESWRLGLTPHEQYLRASSIENAKGIREVKGRYVRPHELKDVFAMCAADLRPHGARDAAIIAVFYCTGLRNAELRQLERDDYDPSTGEIIVRRDKLHRRRTAYITNEGKAALDEWLRVRGREPGPIFCTIHRKGYIQHHGICCPRVARIVGDRAVQAGLVRFTPQELRRSFISNLLEMGVDLLTTRELAGHINLSSTVLYDYRGKTAMQSAADMVSIPYTAAKLHRPQRKRLRVNPAAARTVSRLSTLFLGKYAWEILDALQGDSWITISIPRNHQKVWYGRAAKTRPRGLVKAPEGLGRAKDTESKRRHVRRYEGLRHAMRALEAHGLVNCDEAQLAAGKHREFAGYRITTLGRTVYRTACAAGMRHQRIELSRLRDRLLVALERSTR